jgi:hypothetical protein
MKGTARFSLYRLILFLIALIVYAVADLFFGDLLEWMFFFVHLSIIHMACLELLLLAASYWRPQVLDMVFFVPRVAHWTAVQNES